MTPIIRWFLTRNVVTATWVFRPGDAWITKTRGDRRERRLARAKGVG